MNIGFPKLFLFSPFVWTIVILAIVLVALHKKNS